MPGEPLIPAAIGLTGKLPAHGDFVRRGDPAATARYDRWLATALAEAAVSDRDGLTSRLAELPAWRFVAVEGDGVIAGAMIASNDKVERIYPLIGFALLPNASCLQAETWSAHAEETLTNARGAADTADTLAATLAAIAIAPDPEPTAPRTTWWHAEESIRRDGPDSALPTGPDFDRLLNIDAVEPEDAPS